MNATRVSFAQWIAALSDYLPAAYIAAYRIDLLKLYTEGATARCAAIYCRAYLLAPEMESDPSVPDYAPPAPVNLPPCPALTPGEA